MAEWLGKPFRNVPRHPVPPLKVSISRKVKEYVAEKYKKAGVERGKYVVIHGIQADSKALMQSKGDTDSLLPIEVWEEITRGLRYLIHSVFFFFNLVNDFRALTEQAFLMEILMAHANSAVKPLFVIPHERERENVEDVVGYDANIVFITTPGQVCNL